MFFGIVDNFFNGSGFWIDNGNNLIVRNNIVKVNVDELNFYRLGWMGNGRRGGNDCLGIY